MSNITIVSSNRVSQSPSLEDTSNILSCNRVRKICQVIYDSVSYPIKLVAELFGQTPSTPPLSPSSLLHRPESQTNHFGKITFAACSIAAPCSVAALYLFYSSFL